jgi:hypothetical protein
MEKRIEMRIVAPIKSKAALTERTMYLGDGLYADYDGFQVEVYASNSIKATNRVFFDPEVLTAFISYVKKLGLTNGQE